MSVLCAVHSPYGDVRPPRMLIRVGILAVILWIHGEVIPRSVYFVYPALSRFLPFENEIFTTQMHFVLDFERSQEIGAYVRMTNKYIIVGRSRNHHVPDFFRDNFECPIVETTINTIRTVGAQCVGNKNALLLPDTTSDQELQHIRNALPPSVKVLRIRERLNCLGNVILCNDNACIIHPDIDEEYITILEDALEVPVYRHTIGSEELVGTFAIMNNQGMLVHPDTTEPQMRELGEMLNIRVIAGTVNAGSGAIGSGMAVNDWSSIAGSKTTSVEIKVAETVFDFPDNRIDPRIVAEEIVQ